MNDVFYLWEGDDFGKSLYGDDKLLEEAIAFEEQQKRTYYSLLRNVDEKFRISAEHDASVLSHQFIAIGRLMRRCVSERNTINNLKSVANKWGYASFALAFFVILYPSIFSDQETSQFLKDYNIELILLVVGVIALTLNIILIFLWDSHERNYNIRLERRIDAAVGTNGCLMSVRLVRNLHDYFDTPVFEGELSYAKALVLAKYVPNPRLIEINEHGISASFENRIMSGRWDAYRSKQ